LVERLLPEDVNTQDNYGDTALTYASIYNHIEIVKLLEAYQKNWFIISKLIWQYNCWYIRIMSKVFYDKPIIDQIFEGFEKDRDKDILLNLVKRLPPEDVNIQNDCGNTVLISASIYCYIEIVKLLLEKDGIDVNIQNKRGDTALIRASENNYIEVVKLLLEIEAIDVNMKINYGYTALISASFYGYTETVELLLKKLIYK